MVSPSVDSLRWRVRNTFLDFQEERDIPKVIKSLSADNLHDLLDKQTNRKAFAPCKYYLPPQSFTSEVERFFGFDQVDKFSGDTMCLASGFKSIEWPNSQLKESSMSEVYPACKTEIAGRVTDSQVRQGRAAPKEHYVQPRLTHKRITTLLVRNVICSYADREILQILDKMGFEGKYDFIYVPKGSQTHANFGYFFVNMKSPEYANEFVVAAAGRKFGPRQTQKLCAVQAADMQGDDLLRHIQRKRIKRNFVPQVSWCLD